jgi:hypothetical protein
VTASLHVWPVVARTIDMPSDGVGDHEASEGERGVSRAILARDNVLTTFYAGFIRTYQQS